MSGLLSLPEPMEHLETGMHHTVACGKDASKVYAWGLNWHGQLGSSSTNFTRPVAIAGFSSPIVGLHAGLGHTVALLKDGGARAWGGNRKGQLGVGPEEAGGLVTTHMRVALPKALRDEGLRSAAVGDENTYFLSSAGRVYACGDNRHGQLGLGAGAPGMGSGSSGNGNSGNGGSGGGGLGAPEPVLVPLDTVDVDGAAGGGDPVHDPVVTLAASARYCLALTASGKVIGWGDGSDGQLGNPASRGVVPEPVRINLGPGRVISLAAGHSFAAAVLQCSDPEK
jgi:alpha-tubulin suppressor-like RCC1 family protein